MANKSAAEIAAERDAADKAAAETAAAEQAEKDRATKDPDLASGVAKTVAETKKNTTNAQKARMKAAADAAEAEAASLEGCETFVVVHPKVNIFVGPDLEANPDADPIHEIEISVGTERTWVDVVDGWATVPKNTQLRASTGKELADYRMKVNLGFFTAIPAVN